MIFWDILVGYFKVEVTLIACAWWWGFVAPQPEAVPTARVVRR